MKSASSDFGGRYLKGIVNGDAWAAGASALPSDSVLNEGELGAIGIHEIPSPKPPLLHSNRVQTRHRGNDVGYPGSTDGVVQIVDVGYPQTAHEIARQWVEAREWEEFQLQAISGQDHPTRVAKRALETETAVEGFRSVKVS
ncbi:hypothetical protein ABIB56_002788 [Glaciihabitans sp. UYNi722]